MKIFIFLVAFSIIGCRSSLAQRSNYPIESFADELRLRAVEYIENDSTAQDFLQGFGEVRKPIPIRVFDTMTCLNLHLADLDGIAEWLRPGEPEWKYPYIKDSLRQLDDSPTRCRGGKDPKLVKLSTRQDPVVLLVFQQIDSVFIKDYYVMPITVYYNSYSGGTAEDPAYSTEGTIIYILIFNRKGEVVKDLHSTAW